MEKLGPYHWGKPPVLRVTGARRQSLPVARHHVFWIHGTLAHTTCYYYYYYYCYYYYYYSYYSYY